MPWLRMMMNQKIKVFVPVDACNRPVQINGLVKIKYQLTQEQTYTCAVSKLSYLPSVQVLSDEDVENLIIKENSRKIVKATPKTKDLNPTLPPPLEDVGILPPKTIVIYTDGGADPNPGEAGSGILLIYDKHILELWEYIGNTTNNVAELTAILKALQSVKTKTMPILLYSDSNYAIGVLNGSMKPKKNLELIAEIQSEMRKCPNLQLLKVKAHVGITCNERVDQLVGYARAIKQSGSRRSTLSNL